MVITVHQQKVAWFRFRLLFLRLLFRLSIVCLLRKIMLMQLLRCSRRYLTRCSRADLHLTTRVKNLEQIVPNGVATEEMPEGELIGPLWFESQTPVESKYRKQAQACQKKGFHHVGEWFAKRGDAKRGDAIV